MPVRISVTEVRREVYRLAGGPGAARDAQSSTRLLGRIFHETFARLFGNDERLNWRTVIAEAEHEEKEWERLLQVYLYKRFIGPRLGRERVHLRNATEEVIAFWQAAKAMNRWMVNLLWAAKKKTRSGKANNINLLMSPEEPLSLRIQEKGWKEPVVLTGIADLVLRLPGRSHWCIVELKLGRGCPEADLAQACLYHQILSSGERDDSGALALVSFTPEKEEQMFEASRIRDAQKGLKELIGRLAVVLPGERIKTALKTVRPKTTKPLEEDPEKYFEQARQLVSIFMEYGKAISLEGDPIPGPTFVRYPIKLGKGVKLNAAQKVAQEVQHRLYLEAPPYVHLSEGSVVIDIQRPDRQNVLFSQIRDQLPALDLKVGCSEVLLGVDLDNALRFADFSEPDNVHILVAGTTGSGKSEWLRSVLAGLILSNTPDTLRLVLIDPKRNAFNELRGSPFLLSSNALIYPDEQPVDDVLGKLADEMDRRYRILQDAGIDTRDQFVEKTGKKMPRIVCVCDEYFDLIGRGKREREALESQIFRLGAKARAAGIHLIIATQQPSRNIIKGALDANMPARVSLKMSKAIESNMLLNQKGAENLLGSGDLLFKDIGDPIRLQSPFLSPDERKDVFTANAHGELRPGRTQINTDFHDYFKK